MKWSPLVLLWVYGVVAAQSLVAVEPQFNPVPLVILLVCGVIVGGLIWLRRRRPDQFAKLAGTASKVAADVRPKAGALADLIREEAAQIEDALLHHPLAQPKNPAQAYVPPVAPPAVLELPPAADRGDGILR